MRSPRRRSRTSAAAITSPAWCTSRPRTWKRLRSASSLPRRTNPNRERRIRRRRLLLTCLRQLNASNQQTATPYRFPWTSRPTSLLQMSTIRARQSTSRRRVCNNQQRQRLTVTTATTITTTTKTPNYSSATAATTRPSGRAT